MNPALPLSADVAILGAGTAGMAAYRAAVANGARALLIESGPYGTTCARVGCMPSKLLIAAAEAAHAVEQAHRFGVGGPDRPEVDGRRVMRRVWHGAVEGLLGACPVRLLDIGDELLARGQTNQTMYFLLSGRLGVYVRREDSEPVAVLHPGETVGELSVDYHRHTVPVQASLLGYFNPDAKASMYMIFGLGWYTVHYPHTGAGLSFVLSDHWSLDASYRFLFTGVYRLSDWKHPVGDHYDVRGHMATVGLNYRFYDPR